jgi:nitrate reductase alpha subunit
LIAVWVVVMSPLTMMMIPYTPAWQEKITGVPREQVIQVARAFADNAQKTNGKSMIIIGAAMNHWYHMDMNYRACINMLVFCGCVGQSGGGWAHYVGQEKLRPQTGWTPLAFALDWNSPAASAEQHVILLCAYGSMAL